MRPIKFRGKSITSGEWFYGSFAYFPDSQTAHIIPCGTCKGEEVICDFVEVNPYTVGQFTGCVNYDDQEIYEDDVVLLKDNRVGVVQFQENLYEFLADFHHLDPEMEILGNIHDNPQYNNRR